jgi:hypothetical protein
MSIPERSSVVLKVTTQQDVESVGWGGDGKSVKMKNISVMLNEDYSTTAINLIGECTSCTAIHGTLFKGLPD